MSGDFQTARTERQNAARPTQKHKETGTGSPSQYGRSRFHPCCDMMLAVNTGQVDRPVAKVSGHNELCCDWGWCLVFRPNVIAPGWRGIGTNRIISSAFHDILGGDGVPVAHMSVHARARVVVFHVGGRHNCVNGPMVSHIR